MSLESYINKYKHDNIIEILKSDKYKWNFPLVFE